MLPSSGQRAAPTLALTKTGVRSISKGRAIASRIFGDLLGLLPVVEPRQKDHELVSSRADHEVPLPDAGRKPVPDFGQKRVSVFVSQQIVHTLEAVDVEREQRPLFPEASGGRLQNLSEPMDEGASAGLPRLGRRDFLLQKLVNGGRDT